MIYDRNMAEALMAALPREEGSGWIKATEILVTLCAKPGWHPSFYAPEFPLLSYFLSRRFVDHVGLPTESTFLNSGRYTISFGSYYEPRAAVSIVYSKDAPDLSDNDIIWINTDQEIIALQTVIVVCDRLASLVKGQLLCDE